MSEIERLVPRLVKSDENSRLFTATHQILSIPAPIQIIDAIGVAPGLGEHQRVISAINLWQANSHIEHFFVAGTNKIEVTQPQLSIERLQSEPFLLKRIEGVKAQVTAEHTRQQADWLIQQLCRSKAKSMALVVSHWHMPRAYLTLLKSMLDADIKVPIYPVVVGTSPNNIVPEYNEPVLNMSAGEVERIKKYTEIGQIASFEELVNYLDWLWLQIPTDTPKNTIKND